MIREQERIEAMIQGRPPPLSPDAQEIFNVESEGEVDSENVS